MNTTVHVPAFGKRLFKADRLRLSVMGWATVVLVSLTVLGWASTGWLHFGRR